MNSSDYAYLSNYGVYSAIALFAVAFVAHALDVAFSVRSLEEKTKLDFSRTRRIGNLATVMIVLAFIALFVAVLFRGISAERVPWPDGGTRTRSPLPNGRTPAHAQGAPRCRCRR